MSRAEILQELRSLQGRCKVGFCADYPACFFATQVASELEEAGESVAIDQPGYQPCPKRDEVHRFHDEFVASSGGPPHQSE